MLNDDVAGASWGVMVHVAATATVADSVPRTPPTEIEHVPRHSEAATSQRAENVHDMLAGPDRPAPLHPPLAEVAEPVKLQFKAPTKTALPAATTPIAVAEMTKLDGGVIPVRGGEKLPSPMASTSTSVAA